MCADFYSADSQKNIRVDGKYDEVMKTLTKCPFCDLKEKYIVKERGNVVLTMNLFPYSDGHLLIIPRRHIEKFCDISPEEWGNIQFLIEYGIKRLSNVLKVTNYNVLYRQGNKSGSSLGHLHLHILPCDTPVLLPNYQEIKEIPEELCKKLKES